MAAIGQDDHTAPGQSGQGGSEPAEQSFDFQRAYSELRPEFTRATQRLSEYEELFSALHDPDPEVQADAMAALGLELDTGSQGSGQPSDEEFVDPLEQEVQQLRSQLDEIRSARELEASATEAQELAQLRDEYVGDAIGFIEEQTGVKFTEQEEEALGNLAIAMEDEQGLPDVQGAYKLLYEGVLEANRERWIASKTGAAQPPLGTTIPADQRPKTATERIAYMDERVRALEDQR